MHLLRSLAVAGAIGLAAPAPAWSAPQWGPPNVQPAYNEGFARGQRAGAEDYRRSDRYQFADESDYRRGDIGYRSQYGDRERYRDRFRRGFEAGYRDGYGGGYGRGGRNDAAYERGLNDGYEAGLNDAGGRRRYNPISEGRYRSADRGYDRRYGSKEAYKNDYRVAFKQGYDRGYQDGRRYDNRSRWGGFFGFRF